MRMGAAVGGEILFGGRREGGRPLGNQISTSLLEGAGGGCWLGWRWWGANAVDRDKTNVVACSARWGGEEGEGGISRQKSEPLFSLYLGKETCVVVLQTHRYKKV